MPWNRLLAGIPMAVVASGGGNGKPLRFICLLLALLLFPLLVLLVAAFLLYGVLLHLAIWASWCARGTHVLLVYSDSPLWHDYIAQQLRPKLPTNTVVLNWSQRRSWRSLSLPVLAFGFFGGSRQFNPLVVVFRPWRWGKTFRFWKAFQSHKHGQGKALARVERELFDCLKMT